VRRDFRDLDLMEVLQEAKPFMSFGPGASPNSIDEGVRDAREAERERERERERKRKK